MAVLDLEESFQALHGGVVALLTERDVVVVSGPDAAGFLQGQCSQDLLPLSEGENAWSLLLTPQGKVVALVRVSRSGADSYILDVDRGWGEQVLERLRRFKLRVKVELRLETWPCLEMRGPGAAAAAGSGLAAGLALAFEWNGLPGVDLLGPGDHDRPREVPLGAVPGVPLGDPGAFEAARIEAGFPIMGAELDESTIPQAAGIVERTVSFTKGCFTGQELVARLDARGSRVPRVLRGIEVEAGAGLPSRGDALLLDGRQVGALTSVGWSPRTRGAVALAYVRREVEPPAELVIGSPDAAGTGPRATVRELPLDPGPLPGGT